jgi:RNA polymerase sigma-70 factor (sigma-E family)
MADRPEFGAYVAARSSRLMRTAYLLCRDWPTAEDLVQTALVKAWLAWHRIEDDPDPYVYRILVNTHASWRKRRWRREVPTEPLPDLAGPGDATRVEDRDALWTALGALNAQERAAVVLRYYADLDYGRIAEILGRPPGTVRSQISRALAKLRVDEAMTPIPEGTER